MHRVENKELYLALFRPYHHHQAVIYSSLEGQYEGTLYVDSIHDPKVAILFTPFGYHFVAGNPETDFIVDEIDNILFYHYLLETGEKEAIVFTSDKKWESILDKVFSRHNGVKDGRNIFKLNRSAYSERKNLMSGIKGVNPILLYEKENNSKTEYPVSRILIDGKCVSYCSGFMIGGGYAEIDVATEEPFRGRGYGKAASLCLLDELLRQGLEPSWCTWPYRIESEKLACSLGFELKSIEQAHIWLEEDCGALYNPA